MTRAWACSSRAGRAAINFSNSASDCVPSSLQGSRCSASSMAPSFHPQEIALPEKLFMTIRGSNCFFFPQLSGLRLLPGYHLLATHAADGPLYGLPYRVHGFHLSLEALCDHIPLQLAIGGQQSALYRKRL